MGADQPVSEDELLRLLKRAASEQGVQAWIVGGFVRDKLLGRAPVNPDVVVEGGSALELADRFAKLAGAAPPIVFERFGTAQVTLPDRLVEFVTARAESYASDSRKPDVRPATLDEDLRRRDFTVNTLVMDLDGNVHDPLGAGLADLAAGILRTPTEPVKTFDDDPLRMLRAVRFAAQLGFDPAPNLLPAMRQMRERLVPPVVSVERTADELRKMLVSERPGRALELLDEGGLLDVILPEVAACKGVVQGGYHTHDVYGHTLLVVAFTPPEELLRLGALFHDVGKPATATPDGAFTGHEHVGADMAAAALGRLRFAQKDIDAVVTLVRLHLRPVYYSSEWSEGAIRRLARDAGAQLERLIALARADLAASAYPHPEKLDELASRISAVLSEQPSRLTSPVSGEDIMSALHLAPGPEVGRVKGRLTELVLDGDIEPTREAVLAYLTSHPDL
jgi:putative nucleotidyltransferase with HDIG domain